MNLMTNFSKFLIFAIRICRERAVTNIRVSKTPHTLEETERTFHAGIRPFELLVGRRGEHHEQACRIRAIGINDRLRIDAVVLRLRHLLGAADDDGLAIRDQLRADGSRLGIGLYIHVGRVDPLFLAIGLFAIERRRDHHALGEQILERFVQGVECAKRDVCSLSHRGRVGVGEHSWLTAKQSLVAHQLVEEARIQQVQDRMLDAADVLVHRQPFLCRRLVYHAGLTLRAGIARVVPGRFHEGIHGVGLAPCGAGALRTGTFVEFRHLGQRRTGTVRYHILRQLHRQLVVRHRHIAASRAMDDWDWAAPITLTRDAPVAQAELHFLFAQAFGSEVGGDGIHRRGITETIIFARIDTNANYFVSIPLLPMSICEGKVRASTSKPTSIF